MGVTAGIFLASILLNEMRYLVYIKYLRYTCVVVWGRDKEAGLRNVP
jgi:hypothetical protein